MSRSHKRTYKGKKRSWLPNCWKGRFGGWRHNEENVQKFIEKNPHMKDAFDDWFLQNEPGHWIHDFHTRPTRAEEREKLQKIKKDEIDPDNTVIRDNRKPHIYYW